MAVFGSWNRRIIFLRGFIFRSLRISSPLGFIKAFTPACVLIAAHLMGCSSEAGLCRAWGQALLPSITLACRSFTGDISADIQLPGERHLDLAFKGILNLCSFTWSPPFEAWQRAPIQPIFQWYPMAYREDRPRSFLGDIPEVVCIRNVGIRVVWFQLASWNTPILGFSARNSSLMSRLDVSSVHKHHLLFIQRRWLPGPIAQDIMAGLGTMGTSCFSFLPIRLDP